MGISRECNKVQATGQSVEGGEEAVWKSLPALESRVESSEGGPATPGPAAQGGPAVMDVDRSRRSAGAQPSSSSVKHQPRVYPTCVVGEGARGKCHCALRGVVLKCLTPLFTFVWRCCRLWRNRPSCVQPGG